MSEGKTGDTERRDELLAADGVLFHAKKGQAKPHPRPLAPLADSHGHLTVFRDHEPARAIARAALAGVKLLVVPVDPTEDVLDVPAFQRDLGGWLDGARQALASLAAAGIRPPSFPSVPAEGNAGATGDDLPIDVLLIAGVHPYGAGVFDDAAHERLAQLLALPRCRGVGEIGLDFTCDVPVRVQEEVFREQLAIARDRKLPVELHIRDEKGDASSAAHGLACRVLAEEGVPDAGCDLHCFTDGVEVMRPFVEMGCYVAFGGAATFAKSDDIRDAAAACPTDRLLSETDCPYMAPVPLRGLECEPAMVAFSAACVADVREEVGASTRQETYDALWANARRLYGVS